MSRMGERCLKDFRLENRTVKMSGSENRQMDNEGAVDSGIHI